MTSTTFFFFFIPLLAIILLAINLIFAPHAPYSEKNSAFECGFHSFLGQNRAQFSVSFFIFALLFLIFDLEILLIFPYALTAYTNNLVGLLVMLVFFILLTVGFAFELGKNALEIDSRQKDSLIKKISSYFFTHLSGFNLGMLNLRSFSTSSYKEMDRYTNPDNSNSQNTNPDNSNPENSNYDNTKPNNPNSQNTNPDNTDPDNTNPQNTNRGNSNVENPESENSEAENSEAENSNAENSDGNNPSTTGPGNHPREQISEEDQEYFAEGADAMMEEPVDNIPNGYLGMYLHDTKEVIQNPSLIGIHTSRDVDKDRALIQAWQDRNAELRAEQARRIEAGELPADTVRATTPNQPFAVSPESSAHNSPVAGPSTSPGPAPAPAPAPAPIPGVAPLDQGIAASDTLASPESSAPNSPRTAATSGPALESSSLASHPAPEANSLASHPAAQPGPEELISVSAPASDDDDYYSEDSSDKSDSQSIYEKESNSPANDDKGTSENVSESSNVIASKVEDNDSSSSKRKREDDDDQAYSVPSSSKRKREDDDNEETDSGPSKRFKEDTSDKDSSNTRTENDPRSDNNVQSENNPDKQSPIDFVVEKQQCEMPDIPDSDGGD